MVDDEYYGVALGGYFGEIGSKYHMTLETGEVIKVCKVEEKADVDTDEDDYLSYGGHFIEFVVDPNTEWMQSQPSSNQYVMNGNFNNYFEGSVIAINKELED